MGGQSPAQQSKRPWWKAGVVYQICPRSFQDSNDDGVGDLKSIRQRLDYVAGLGVDPIWLSSIFPSPMADFGYDVADDCGAEAMFGDLAQFDALLAEVDARGLKLLLDFVPNHSSTEHPWFVESRSSCSNLKRDWCFWRDPAPGGGASNNWTCDMGGPSCEFDTRRGNITSTPSSRNKPTSIGATPRSARR